LLSVPDPNLLKQYWCQGSCVKITKRPWFILGSPCLTILDHPVWPITHEKGTNILVGSDCQKLREGAFKILSGNRKKGNIPELWDGKAAERIVEILAVSDKKSHQTSYS
jgi:UDP-N-acetylglucosamine 2-epimerase